MRPPLIAISMARKPIEANTIAENAVKHGTGGINISATRIPAIETGRWPANLIVQHAPGCQPDLCTANCAVRDINRQDQAHAPGSTFFLNVFPSDDSFTTPQMLIDYLTRMITVDGGHCLVLRDMGECDLTLLPATHYHGGIVRGEPTIEQCHQLLRVLRPGAHLFVIAPEHRPTGHVGTCRIEDAGFEIRDAILWVRDAGHVHYVPKAPTSEREAGLAHLPEKMFAPSGGAQNALAAAEQSGGDAHYDEGNGIGFNTISKRRNHHPTVKPRRLMVQLLRQVPGPVLDPFMGSGTTLTACVETGHDAIGIEREPDYMNIADARVRHWNQTLRGRSPANIMSDRTPPPPAPESTEISIDDFLGL